MAESQAKGRSRPAWLTALWLVSILTLAGLLARAGTEIATLADLFASGTARLVVVVCVSAAELGGVLVGFSAIAGEVLVAGGLPKPSVLVRGGIVAVEMLTMWGLSAVLPFRFGLLSCLYYCLPAVLLALLVAPRTKRRVVTFSVLLVAGALLVVPVRALQASLAAQQWLEHSGASGRAQAQVVVMPGFGYDPYELYQGTVIANFDGTMHDGETYWAAVETVTAGKADPCGKVTDAEGDADGDEALPCKQVAENLWLRGGQADQDIGYVLQRDGMTITVIAPPDTDADALRQAVLAAHPASNEELWSREGATGRSFPALLLL